MCSKRTFHVNNVFLSKYKHQSTPPEMVQFFPSSSSTLTQTLSTYKILKKKSKPSLKQSLSSIQKQLCNRVSYTPFPHALPSSPSLLHSPHSRGMHCFCPLQQLAAQHSVWFCDMNIKRKDLQKKPAGSSGTTQQGPGTEHQTQLCWTRQTQTPWSAQLRASIAPTAHFSRLIQHHPEPNTAGQEQGLEGFSSAYQVKYSTIVFPLDNKSLTVWKPCIFTQVNSLSTCSYRKSLRMFVA